jgi:hypothetical protein
VGVLALDCPEYRRRGKESLPRVKRRSGVKDIRAQRCAHRVDRDSGTYLKAPLFAHLHVVIGDDTKECARVGCAHCVRETLSAAAREASKLTQPTTAWQ